MGIPVKEQEQAHQHAAYADVRSDELDGPLEAHPAITLAGEESDESEPHIWRGID